MLNRRMFLEKTLQGAAVGAAGAMIAASDLWAAGQLAWPKPIGLEMYTVREEFPKDPAGTLKKISAVGYREVEISTEIPAATLKGYLRDANLAAPSTYPEAPKDVDAWKKTLDHIHPYGFRYVVVGDNPTLDAEAWKRRADLFNQCGSLAQQAGLQFCYHAHFHEFAPLGDTSGYGIMLTQCDPKLLKFEMDCFWATYAGQDPVKYFEEYPGRFPLLHIKDFKKGVSPPAPRVSPTTPDRIPSRPPVREPSIGRASSRTLTRPVPGTFSSNRTAAIPAPLRP